MKNLSAIIFCVMVNTAAFAQNNNSKVKVQIPEISLVDIETGQPSPDIVLQVYAPQEAGLAPLTQPLGSNAVWINYTSVTKGKNTGTKRLLLVKISSGSLPSGVSLVLKAYEATNTGKGKKGVPKSENLTVSSTDQEIIGSIESSYTGNGSGKGHLVEYSLNIDADAMTDLDANLNNTELTIVYTLQDN